MMMQVLLQAKHRIMSVAEKYGLTTIQSHTLLLLTPENPSPMNSLSTWLACDASNVTGIVDRLESQGLITRQDNPADRRVKMITLTPAGLHQRNNLLHELFSIEKSELADILTASEIHTLVRLLDKLQRGIQAGARVRSPAK